MDAELKQRFGEPFIEGARNSHKFRLKRWGGVRLHELAVALDAPNPNIGLRDKIIMLKEQYRVTEAKNGNVPWGWNATLDAVDHLLPNIRRRLVFEPIHKVPESEDDIVCEWKDLFCPFVTMSEHIRAQSGECVCKASQRVRSKLDGELGDSEKQDSGKHDSGKHGRKVDLIFSGGTYELSNFEFKVDKSNTCKECILQHLKNIRLNRAIMETLFKRWPPHPQGRPMARHPYPKGSKKRLRTLPQMTTSPRSSRCSDKS
ncbi:MAG: hypothetical protein J3Q66DRAFT_445300 [Benniella sp.]|nr:MAG: hypothetical protein J3Q66DRAFT_445300 [Benniella sp.]